MRIGSWCSGVGALDLAVEELTGGKVVWQSETDPAASRVLAQHWPGVPNHGDLRTFDWATAEPVDAVCAGFPCQPASSAGKRRGMADERWLWDDIARAVGNLGTRWVFLENVPGLLTVDGGQAFARVVHDLAHLGFVGRYRLLPAAAVGAPHRRDRVFLAAHAPGEGRQGLTLGCQGQGERGGRVAGGFDPTAAHAGCVRGGLRGDAGPGEDQDPSGQVDSLGGCGGVAAFGRFQPAIDRWAAILGRPAPAPLNERARGTTRRLNPRFVEWMQGLPDGWVTDHVGRRDALRCLGNAVVSQAAVAAYRSLLA